MHRHKRKEKSKLFNAKNAVGIFVVVMMLASGIAFILNTNQGGMTSDSYNGQIFVSNQRGEWFTEMDGKMYQFSYHPTVVDYLNISQAVIDKLKTADVVYITYDPNDRYITNIENLRFDMESDIYSYFNIIPEIGVTQQTEEYSDFSIIDCNDGTPTAPVLKLQSGEKIAFESFGNCVVIYADDEYGFNLARDRLFYGLLGIIE